MKFKPKTLIVPIILLLFCLYQMSSLFNSYWPSSHDGIFHLIRIREYIYQFKSDGIFPLRWVSRLDNGYGLPLFNYIYPLPYFLGFLFSLFTNNEIILYKIVVFLSYFLGVFGFYFCFLKKNRFLAFISAILYGCTPYFFLNLFVRGALGEALAMGLLPWVYYFFSNKKYLLSSVSLAFLLTAHNFVGFIFLAFIIVYLIWTGKFNRYSFFSLLLGFGLSAFFVIPMILEKNLIISGATNNFTFNYQEHFLYWKQLIYGKWDYWYSLPGPKDGLSFQLGFANLLILIMSPFAFIKSKNKKNFSFWLIALFCSIFLTLIQSQFIWKIISPLQIIQFPWRFLFLISFIFPIIFFKISTDLKISKIIIYPLAIFLMVLSFINVRNYRRPMDFVDQSRFQTLFNEQQFKTTTAVREEIAPQWSLKEKFNASNVVSFTVQNPGQTTINVNYFPGLCLIEEKTKKCQSISPNKDGIISAYLNSGNYILYYCGTTVEFISNLISLISLFALPIIYIKLWLPNKP